jgi:hypothetical protein
MRFNSCPFALRSTGLAQSSIGFQPVGLRGYEALNSSFSSCHSGLLLPVGVLNTLSYWLLATGYWLLATRIRGVDTRAIGRRYLLSMLQKQGSRIVQISSRLFPGERISSAHFFSQSTCDLFRGRTLIGVILKQVRKSRDVSFAKRCRE